MGKRYVVAVKDIEIPVIEGRKYFAEPWGNNPSTQDRNYGRPIGIYYRNPANKRVLSRVIFTVPLDNSHGFIEDFNNLFNVRPIRPAILRTRRGLRSYD